MQSSATPRPDFVRQATGESIARLSLGILIVGLVVSVVLGALLAGILDGWVRLVVLGPMALLVLTGALILWQGIRTFRLLAVRRENALAEMREKRLIGVLAYSSVPGWDDRVQRDLVLPAVPHLLVANAGTIGTPEGQRAIAVLGDLIGRPPPPSGVYELPGRATLALFDHAGGDDDVSIWDLSTFFERIDSGDDEAGEEFHELQLHVQQLSMAVASFRP